MFADSLKQAEKMYNTFKSVPAFTRFVKAEAAKGAKFLGDSLLVVDSKEFQEKLWVQTKDIRHSWGGVSGGRPWVCLSIDLMRPSCAWFREAASFEEDPEIGRFSSQDAEKHISAVTMHELAHAAVYWENVKAKPHGKEWQSVYRALRKEFGLVRGAVKLN